MNHGVAIALHRKKSQNHFLYRTKNKQTLSDRFPIFLDKIMVVVLHLPNKLSFSRHSSDNRVFIYLLLSDVFPKKNQPYRIADIWTERCRKYL